MSDPLDKVPFLGGYNAQNRLNREQESHQLGSAMQMMTLRGAFARDDEMAKVRQIMQTETDPQKVIQALTQLGPTGAAAAHQYATAVKEAATAKALQDLQKGGLDPSNPDALLRASMIPGMAHLGPEAERLRKVKENRAALGTLRDQPPQLLPAGAVAPGTNQQLVQNVPAEDRAAFMRVASGAATSAAPQEADTQPTGGLFTSLITSKNPAIANQAKMMQARLNASGEAVPAQHWLDIQKQLASQDATMTERRAAAEEAVAARPSPAPQVVQTDQGPMHVDRNGRATPIVGPDGQPVQRPTTEKALPSSAAQKLFENQQNLRRAETALALMEGKDVGEMKGDPDATGWKGFLPDAWLQRMDPKGTDARAALADLGSLVIHERSGAAVTAAEFPRLQPFIPKINDDPETAKKKLKRFAQVYRDIASETANFYRESGYKVPDLVPGVGAAPAAPQKYPTATAPNGRKVIYKDGKWQTP